MSMIPPACQRILDIGCGSGENLKNHPGEISGVEFNPEAAEKARKHLKQVVTADIEASAGNLPFEKNHFDCLVFADVLEHMYDPWGTFEKLRAYLKPGGYVLVSVPNIRHYSVLKSLIFRGEFRYAESGILDIDHTRFFTKKGLESLLHDGGFTIVDFRRKISATKEYKLLNAMVFGAAKDFLTEQFYILGQSVQRL